MKQKIIGFISLLSLAFLLLCCFSASARLLMQINHGEKEFRANEMIIQADAKDDFSNLIGAEKCYEKDEECLERRMIADAGLDYIYSQSNKP
ncbi:putative phytosulfokines 6 isoform X2 [Gossypium arboreum]|uniref:putative phytosulfokines 6 isoform X2 n=1 Tax=Gossypium arboreum TaxID=29729 RepID=UPI0008191EC9|nr:putative phytosulfokines 6 isoform X2 [Gossypium arboreum]